MYIMKTENKIIKCFIEDNQPKTIREIAKKIDADYKITHTAVQKLIAKKVILLQTVGKSSLCSLNNQHYSGEIYLAENERKENILKNSDIKAYYKEIMAKTDTSLFICLLFGSYAKGKPRKHSDMDLMFISNEKDFEERISNILRLLPVETHILVFSEEEFIRMKDAKKPNVVQEAIRNNIILYGIESYYRLKNA